MPGLPPALTARIQDGARVVTLLGPRFRAQDLVLVTPAGESRLARLKGPVLGGPWGWVPVPKVAPSLGLHFERWDGVQRGYHVLAHLDLGPDAASIHDPALQAPWAPELTAAMLTSPHRITLQGIILRCKTDEELYAALKARPEPVYALFAEACRQVDPPSPEPVCHDGLASELQRLAGLLWQHRPPPLRLIDAPALGRHGRAGWRGKERLVAVSAAMPREHIVQQVVHEWMHAITDPLVQADHGARDTRMGSDGFAIHQQLEQVALMATEALLTEKAPEHLPGFHRWLTMQR